MYDIWHVTYQIWHMTCNIYTITYYIILPHYYYIIIIIINSRCVGDWSNMIDVIRCVNAEYNARFLRKEVVVQRALIADEPPVAYSLPHFGNKDQLDLDLGLEAIEWKLIFWGDRYTYSNDIFFQCKFDACRISLGFLEHLLLEWIPALAGLDDRKTSYYRSNNTMSSLL